MWANLRADLQRFCDEDSGQSGGLRKALQVVMTEPGFHAVWAYRVSRWLHLHHVPLIGSILQRFIEVWSGITIPPTAVIGPGLLIYHFGGIVINSQTVMGQDCTLHHSVTIGNRRPGGGSPRIGNRVMIGVGACVLGEFFVGDDAEIGANAVVLDAVPERGVAVGIPAKVIRVKPAQGDTRRAVLKESIDGQA